MGQYRGCPRDSLTARDELRMTMSGKRSSFLKCWSGQLCFIKCIEVYVSVFVVCCWIGLDVG